MEITGSSHRTVAQIQCERVLVRVSNWQIRSTEHTVAMCLVPAHRSLGYVRGYRCPQGEKELTV